MATNHQVLDKSESNMLIQRDTGEVENVPLSPLNRLLFDHNLWGLLREGGEILRLQSNDERGATIIAGDDARTYTLDVGSTESLHIGEHQKGDLVDALIDVYESDERRVAPIVELYDRLRASMVRQRVVNYIAQNPPTSSHVEIRADGWLIHGDLLLTWDSEFVHPETTSRTVRGSGVREGASDEAYQMQLGQTSSENRTLTIDGETRRLTDSEMKFVAKAMWSIKKAPNNRSGQA